MVGRGRLRGKDAIGVRVGRVINKYKVAKHFELTIDETAFEFSRKADSIDEEAALDGIYIVRTCLSQERCSAEATVRSYKLLSNVERAFRSMKTLDLKVRPIYHHLESRVRAHIFIAMLAYYVEWHMKQVWRELLFSDEFPEQNRDPVVPARRSEHTLEKVRRKRTKDGRPAHSFATLLATLATITKSTCRRLGANTEEASFVLFTKPSPLQARALELVGTIKM
jgi:hypothetical protein